MSHLPKSQTKLWFQSFAEKSRRLEKTCKTGGRTMTSTLAKHAGLTVTAYLALGLNLTPAWAAEELRIGFLAPMTGPFAQVGRDMVNGFEMYLDEVKSEFAGAKVKFIEEDGKV